MPPKNRAHTLRILFITFFKAGTFTFAGGLAMLPALERDLVTRYELLSRDDFLEYATLAQSLPGIIALNCAAFVGRRTAGIPGMIVAGIGSIISAFVLMLVATIALQYIPQSGRVAGAMRAIRAASAALILSAAFSLGKHNIKTAFSVAVMVGAFALVALLRVSTPLVILGAALLGIISVRLASKKGGPSK